MITLPSWAPGEGSVALLERAHDEEEIPDEPRFEEEIPDEPRFEEEENPYWWVLSTLDTFEGKEAREKYYAGI
jgi:hypothetical protein